MRKRRSVAWLLGLCGALASCAPPSARASAAAGRAPAPEGRASRTAGATIFTSAELGKSPRPLLTFMRQRIAGLQVRSTPLCPEIVLRGRSTLVTSSSPAVYFDGLLTTNTCILQDLNTANLSRVEVYPGGIPGRPGYRTHPYGVILIFGRQAFDSP